jgi:hypothetical protein
LHYVCLTALGILMDRLIFKLHDSHLGITRFNIMSNFEKGKSVHTSAISE